MDLKFDLHMHSTASDGTDTPIELVDLAKGAGLAGISITDHDTVAGYTSELFEHAKARDVHVGVGVEFSTRHNGHSVHVLGYGVDIKNSDLLAFCDAHQERRYKRNLAICQKLAKMGMSVGEDWLKEDGVPLKGIGRPHIASRMLERGYIKDIKQAFSRYLGDDKCAFVQSKTFSVEETIDLIHTASGKAFIAHPQLIKRQRLLREVLAMSFDGLECYYGTFGGTQADKWLEIAREKEWMISGGSDYHGKIKPEIHLGCSYVTEHVFKDIFNV